MLRLKLKTLSLTLIFATAFTCVPSIVFQAPITANAAVSSVSTATIAEILANQNADGGWKKGYTTTSGDWSKSTIDNKATYTEIRKLAAEYTKTKDSVYSEAVLKGINFLLKMQYSNGGWPQIYGGSGYHTAITYNDDAMINVMYLLDEISKKSGDFSFVDDALAGKCADSVNKGIYCILNTQITENGNKTIWCQQHDKDTLKAAGGRAYELPSLCTSESANIIKFLKTRPSTPEIKNAIDSAAKWFYENKITGIKVVKTNGDTIVQEDPAATTPIWARCYEIGTDKPIFVGRDGVAKYSLAEIEKERRNGYAWYGNWGKKVMQDYNPTEKPSTDGLKLDYSINNWGSGYQVNFKISNQSTSAVNSWTLKLKKSDIHINISWNVNIKEDGDYYVITPADWNAKIEKDASIEFGVQGTKNVNNTINYELN